jgi:hypothetical protein
VTLAYIADLVARTLSRRVNAQLGATDLVPNGGFEEWGGGTSFPPATFAVAGTEYPVATNWVARKEQAADTLTVEREATIRDGEGGKYALKLIKGNANGLASVRSNLPARTVAEWAGRTVTIRARLWGTVSSNTRLTLHDGVATSSGTTTVTGTYTTMTVTRTIDPAATAIWVGLEVGVAANAADTVYLDNLTAVFGPVTSSYAPPGLVMTAGLADLAVIGAKIANGTMLDANFSQNTIHGNKIANVSLATAQLAAVAATELTFASTTGASAATTTPTLVTTVTTPNWAGTGSGFAIWSTTWSHNTLGATGTFSYSVDAAGLSTMKTVQAQGTGSLHSVTGVIPLAGIAAGSHQHKFWFTAGSAATWGVSGGFIIIVELKK